MAHRKSNLYLRGRSPRTRTKINTWSSERVCVILECSVHLSQYNSLDRCWPHRKRHAPRLRAPTEEQRHLSQLPVCKLCDESKRLGWTKGQDEISFEDVIHIQGFDGEGLVCESENLMKVR